MDSIIFPITLWRNLANVSLQVHDKQIKIELFLGYSGNKKEGRKEGRKVNHL